MSLCETYPCTISQHYFWLSYNRLNYDLQSISKVYSKELGPSFHRLFLAMFASKLRIRFSQRSKLHQGY